MKKDFNSEDLRDEYKGYYESYRVAYLKGHPDCDRRLCEAYAARMVRRRAQKLYDYRQILDKINANAELQDILPLHKSCAERGCDGGYYKILQDILSEAKTVFDICCGLNPCMIAEEFPNIDEYFCYDRDARISKLLQILNEKHLSSKLSVLSDDMWNDDMMSQLQPDVVLAQKLIPNLFYSHNTKITDRIAQINAKYWFVSGAIYSLSRNVSIQKDERTALEWFIGHYGFQKIKYVQTHSEFGWILSKPDRSTS